MANLAQTVNVLQSLILTKEEKVVLTPTYYVFEMYKVHQDAVLLPVELECDLYHYEEEKMDALNVSASKDKDGKIHVSLCNMDPHKTAKIMCELRGGVPLSVAGRLLTAEEMTTHNTFENPKAITPLEFKDAMIEGQKVSVVIPSKSVVVLEIVLK
jgi:alpha-N-arabinofuranosidase